MLTRLSLLPALWAGIGMACIGAVAAVAQDRPGQVFHVTPSDMPEPFATDSVGNGSDAVARDGRSPDAPDGFTVTLFAEGMTGARNLVVDGNGRVVLARSRAGVVELLEDTDGDGRADRVLELASGLNRPHGLALWRNGLWIADQDRIYRIEWGETPGEPVPMSAQGIFGESGGHWTRNIAFSPDGRYLFSSIGSRGNVGEEPEPRATIQRHPVAGDGRIGTGETFASGLRNPVGIAFQPGTDRLYTVVNERDGMGDGLVPDFFTAVTEGAFYGWPYAYIGRNPQPDLGDRRPDLVAATVVPDVLFESHSAPIGFSFLAGADVPDEWQDDALVALRGSWNAAVPTGYKVVRVEFADGAPTGRYVNFLTGFRVDVPQPGVASNAKVFGRPVGVAVGPDGSIHVSDDTGGTIWRVTR